ncbi:hypothetical protein PGTUg99_030448 [Puccinia graminis f. sp. tritici]|uniref:Pre-rRNA-processing protein RIX1 n=1 Tax=Puccinia graminis f. sp. tritici TaxID=56615 RepID=A0A5B0R8Q2_PUCGR|nr:hypothetical protein PGTUg99_030448 [Puccinia graminis f. sp. tritici]
MSTSSYSQTIEYLLNTYLANDQQLSDQIANSICSTFDQTTAITTPAETTTTTTTEINRWFNRINSLLISKNESLNSLGARLARLTLQKDPDCLTNQGARWIQASQNIIARHQPVDHICLSHQIHLILNIFEWATRWPDFARENCDPKAIITLARSLIAISEDRIEDPKIRSLGLRTLAILITRYASIMRPLASQLQTLALTNILNPEKIISQGGTSLLTQLYRLSGKTDASTSWSKTIKATIGTIELILHSLLSPFLNESESCNPNRDSPLAPLEIPAQDLIYTPDLTSTPENVNLPSYRIPLLLRRIDRLLSILLAMLSQSTDRPVCVPIGELAALASRLLLIGRAQAHDRADQAWKLGWEALGGTVTLRVMGCRLISRLVESLTFRLTPFTTQILTILASEIESNNDPKEGHKTADVSVMYGTYARIISWIPCNPEVLKTTLEPVIKVLLRDIQFIYGSLPPSSSSSSSDQSLQSSSKQSKKSRKKSNRFASHPSWNSTLLIDPLELNVAERALDTLEILIGAVPHGFPSPYLTLSVRAVLSLAVHPSFITPVRDQTGEKAGILSSTTRARSPALGYASRPTLRAKVLSCLMKAMTIQRTSSQEIMGLNLAQTLSGVFQALLSVQDGGASRLIEMARQGQAVLALLARPRVPPVFPSSSHLHLEIDLEPVQEENDESDSSEDDDLNLLPPPQPSVDPSPPAPAQPPQIQHLSPVVPSISATTTLPSVDKTASLPTWHSTLSSLHPQTHNGLGDQPSQDLGKKRKSLEEPQAFSRPLKKTFDQSVALDIESDSSDDDDDDDDDIEAVDGKRKRKEGGKLPQLVFDDDEEEGEEEEEGQKLEAEEKEEDTGSAE